MNMNTIEQSLSDKIKHMSKSDFEKFIQKLYKMYNKSHQNCVWEVRLNDENR